MAYATRPLQQFTREKLLSDCGSVCGGLSCTSGNGWSGVKSWTGVQAESVRQFLCSGCDRNRKQGTHCDLCGRWCHNSDGNIMIQVAESGKWFCDRCG